MTWSSRATRHRRDIIGVGSAVPRLGEVAFYDVSMDPLEELEASLEDRVVVLPERKRKMMRLRLGLVDGRQWDLREVAREFDTDRDEVRAVEAEFFGD
jgi:hypothetical protein